MHRGNLGEETVSEEVPLPKENQSDSEDGIEDEGYGSLQNSTSVLARETELSEYTSDERRYPPRRILGQGEKQYSVRLGSGVQSPALLLDGTQPDSLNVHFDIISEDAEHTPEIKVCTYSRDDVTPYTQNKAQGHARSSDILTFMFRTEHQNNLKCCLTLYFGNGAYLGRAYLSLDHATSLEDAKLPIINDTHTIVGILNCSVVEVRGFVTPDEPLSSTEPHQSASYHGYAHCDVANPLEVGHRGCGVTQTDRQLFTELPCLGENTIASLSMAYRHGAHMVETDVVVTQDQRAVLHHDLEIELSDRRKVPICHVASNVLENIPSLPLTVTSEERKAQLLISENDTASLEAIQDQNRMFPYLTDILTKLPPSLGLMLEVKADLPEEGMARVEYHTDRNAYIDVILRDLFTNAAHRNIILCSFCPTTCTLLRNKQDRWPVFIILQGSTETYVDYSDHRLRCLDTAVNFALSEDLQGVSLFSGLLQEYPSVTLKSIRDRGLKTFVWGFHNCQKEFRAKMRTAGVNGIIYDRIYEEELGKRVSSA